MQTQETTVKERRTKESKPKEVKLAESKNPAPPRFESTELEKTFRTDKKKEYFEKKKKKRDRKNNTLATRDNANAVEVGKKKK